MLIGYMRISKQDGSQCLDLQNDALIKAGIAPERIFEDKDSGRKDDRPGLRACLKALQPGNTLVVWKLDRLARNMNDLTRIMDKLNKKGAALEILDQHIDTSTATGKAFLQMLGVFAEFETNLRKERQLAGIAAAKAKGKHLGRRASLTDIQKQEIRGGNKNGATPSVLAKTYGVSRGTIYNVLKG